MTKKQLGLLAPLLAGFFIAFAPDAAMAQRKLPPTAIDARVPNAQTQATNIISSGVISPSYASIAIAAESGTADDLATVTVTSWKVGDTIKIIADAGDTITLKHGTGNITTDTGQDFDLDDSAYVWLDVTASGVTLRRGGAGGGGDAILASSYGDLDDDEDWTTTLETAFAAAKAANKPFSCAGIAGYITVSNLDIPSLSAGETFTIRDCKFKHQTPNTDGTNILRSAGSGTNVGNIVLENVILDRAGDSADNNNTKAIRFDNLESVTLINVEAYGDNHGEVVRLEDIDRVNLQNLYVHDARYFHASETNDAVEGVVLKNIGSVLGSVRVENLGRTDQTSAARDWLNRAVVIDYVRGGHLNIFAQRVDQCVDVSGSQQSRVTISGVARWCNTWGVKMANATVGATFQNFIIEQPGLGCAVVGAANPSSTDVTSWSQHNLISGLVCKNVGTNGNFSGGNTAGIVIGAGNPDSSPGNEWPKDIVITNNLIASDSGSATFTASGDTMTIQENGMPVETGVRVRLTTTGSLPTGLATGTDYWLVALPGTLTFKLASSFINAQDGTVITTTGAGSGTHTVTLQSDMKYGIYTDMTVEDTARPIVAAWNTIKNPITAKYSGAALEIFDIGSQRLSMSRSAIGGDLPYLEFKGPNDSGAVVNYADIVPEIGDDSAGAQDGTIRIRNWRDGSPATVFWFADGAFCQGVSDQGTNTLNCGALYENNTAISSKYAALASPTFTGTVTTAGQIAFPSTANPSSNANTLDDYEEGTWTPGITFATPGDLSVSYTSQGGDYTIIGRKLFFDGVFVTSAFTHSTASSFMQITGLPASCADQFRGGGSISLQGWTKANFTDLDLETSNSTYLYVLATGSGQTPAELTAADLPSGGTVKAWFHGSCNLY